MERFVRKLYNEIKTRYDLGGRYLTDSHNIETDDLSVLELAKEPPRYDVINLLIKSVKKEITNYLEIGVRNPGQNFNKIESSNKISVDPGVEFKENPVDLKLTSDEFFNKLASGELKDVPDKYDVIFIDGLHLAEQVNRDIDNALNFIYNDGFVVLHDCNPPTEYHAREDYSYNLSPAKGFWSGTVWKAFYKRRFDKTISCCCIDSDWGIGIISKTDYFNDHLEDDFNPFLEYSVFTNNREKSLNIVTSDSLKEALRVHI